MIDNFYNSSTEAVQRIEAIVGKSVPFENVDLTDLGAVKGVFAKYPIDSVIHFAALKVTALSERMANNCRPSGKVLKFRWNIIGSISVGQ